MNAMELGSSYKEGWRGARLLAACALATAMMAQGNAASAAGERSIAVSGNSTFSDCGGAGADLALLMTGDLTGCLSVFIQDYTCNELGEFDHYREYGRETFVGTWRGKAGSFTTDYTVDAAYAKGFCTSLDYTLQLSGSCIHRIGGGTGAFANAKGVFKLFDVVTGVTGDPVTGQFAAGSGANNFLYYGSIRTNGLGRPSATLQDLPTGAGRTPQAAIAAAGKARSGRSC
ncbi:hypothetical protein [Luteimonas vadosa]